MLSESGDAKNYHAWGHRQWVLRTFGGWEDELAYVEELLQEDLRNNSAWNQRFYVLQNTQDLTQLDVVRGEVAYALRCATHPRPNPRPNPRRDPRPASRPASPRGGRLPARSLIADLAAPPPRLAVNPP